MKRLLKLPIIWFVLFLTLCFVALGGIVSGVSGLTTTEAKVLEVTKGIENSDEDFSSVYQTIRLEYDYRGERYAESVEGDATLRDVNPGDMVKVSFDSKYPHAVVKTEVPKVNETGTAHKVSGWEMLLILILAVPMAVLILYFMIVLHESENKTSSRKGNISLVK